MSGQPIVPVPGAGEPEAELRYARTEENRRQRDRLERMRRLLTELDRPVKLIELLDEFAPMDGQKVANILRSLIVEGAVHRIANGWYMLAPPAMSPDEEVAAADHAPARCPRCYAHTAAKAHPALGYAIASRHRRILYRCSACSATFFIVDPTSALRP